MKNIDDDIKHIRARFEKLAWTLDERMRRLFAAAEASTLGHCLFRQYRTPFPVNFEH